LLSILASEVRIANAKPEDEPVLRSHGDIELKANAVHAENALSAAGGNIAIASENPLRLYLGQYRAVGLISVTAADMTTSAGLESKQGVSLQTSKSVLHNKGRISS